VTNKPNSAIEMENKAREALKRPQRLKPNLSVTAQETYKEIHGVVERYQHASKLAPAELEKLNLHSSQLIKRLRRPVGGVVGLGGLGDTSDCLDGCQTAFDDCMGGIGEPEICTLVALICMSACFIISD
jgi:hypothetical protein